MSLLKFQEKKKKRFTNPLFTGYKRIYTHQSKQIRAFKMIIICKILIKFGLILFLTPIDVSNENIINNKQKGLHTFLLQV